MNKVVTYEKMSDLEKADVRLRALVLAHNPDLPPEVTVDRAKAYMAFVEGE